MATHGVRAESTERVRGLVIDRIFHPSDLTRASELAFIHALRLALATRAELSLLHVDERGSHSAWGGLPGVRDTLIRWGVLAAGCARDEVARLGIKVTKTEFYGSPPVEAIMRHLAERPADLIVLANHRRQGLERLTQTEVAAPVSRLSGTMTLFVPDGVQGFVSPETGELQLAQVLIPVDHRPAPQPSLDAARDLAHTLGIDALHVRLLHIGPDGPFPEVRVAATAGLSVERELSQGDIVDTILRVARHRRADLIVLATEGRHGFLDALRGSTAERLVNGAPCPVLAVPA